MCSEIFAARSLSTNVRLFPLFLSPRLFSAAFSASVFREEISLSKRSAKSGSQLPAAIVCSLPSSNSSTSSSASTDDPKSSEF